MLVKQLRKLLNKNISKEEISEITGLNKKEIDKIAKEKYFIDFSKK